MVTQTQRWRWILGITTRMTQNNQQMVLNKVLRHFFQHVDFVARGSIIHDYLCLFKHNSSIQSIQSSAPTIISSDYVSVMLIPAYRPLIRTTAILKLASQSSTAEFAQTDQCFEGLSSQPRTQTLKSMLRLYVARSKISIKFYSYATKSQQQSPGCALYCKVKTLQ